VAAGGRGFHGWTTEFAHASLPIRMEDRMEGIPPTGSAAPAEPAPARDHAPHDHAPLDHVPHDHALPERAEELAALLRLTDRLYRSTGLDEVFEAALDAITSALGCERASILLFDGAGVMRFVASRGLSDAYRAAVDGHSPWRPGERDPEPIFVEDIERTDEPGWIKQTIRAEGIRGLAFIPLVAKGETIGKFMTYHARPHPFAEAEKELAVHIARQVGFSLERARAEEGRRQAEGALRETEDRFRLMSENAPVMLWVSRPDGSCLHLNRMLREFWDVDEDAVSAFDWSQTVHPDDAERVMHAIRGAIATRNPVNLEARYRGAAGEYRVLETHASPRLGADGAFLGMIGVNVDTTERKRAEQGRELLLAELSHRVKNMLAVVQGIARQTFRSTRSLAEARESFEGRLMALATAHDLLTRASWTSAAVEDIARGALPIREERPQIALSGPYVALDPKQTLSLAMALHELYTNAIKYGALLTEAGRITLAWSVTPAPERRLKIEWRETCAPAPPADTPDDAGQPPREGFGTRLIRQIFTHDLAGAVAIDFAPDGLTCTAEVPLPSA
jgi:PAS domain S-box-containing protein